MTATSQLALCFDFEPLPVQRMHQPIDRRRPRQLGDPYYTFDAALARRTILEQLRKTGGEWVRRRALMRATGMRPQDVGPVIAGLVRVGIIDETDSHRLIHPSHGFMGHTRGYRITQEGANHE